MPNALLALLGRDREVAPTECKRRNELRDYKRVFS